MEKALLTSKDASNLIGCSQSTLRNYEVEGLIIPVMKVGKRRYYSSSQVQKFIVECCGGSDEIADVQGRFFMTSLDVQQRLSLSYEALDELDKQGVLSPCRRLPLSHKRLYSERDVENFISSL